MSWPRLGECILVWWPTRAWWASLRSELGDSEIRGGCTVEIVSVCFVLYGWFLLSGRPPRRDASVTKRGEAPVIRGTCWWAVWLLSYCTGCSPMKHSCLSPQRLELSGSVLQARGLVGGRRKGRSMCSLVGQEAVARRGACAGSSCGSRSLADVCMRGFGPSGLSTRLAGHCSPQRFCRTCASLLYCDSARACCLLWAVD